MSNAFNYVSFLILCCVQVFVWSRLYDEKVNLKRISLYISLCVMFVLGFITYFYTNAFLRMILDMLIFFSCNYLIFRRKLNEVIVSVIYCHFLLALCDLLIALVVMLFLGIDSAKISDDVFFTSCGNLLISFSLILISNIKIVKRIYLKLLNITSRIKIKIIFFICIFVMICINFLMASVYYSLNSIFIIIINSCFILVYSFIIYKSLNERNINIIIKSHNEHLIESLHQYEEMVDRQRVDNHENKNQLLIIKNMIKKDDKDVVKYIDTVIKDKKEDDETLYTRVKTIPSGGLQGIIYQKMLVMKDENIFFSLDVSRDVRKIELDCLSMDDNYRLCKIVGVFLDNSIEESRKIDDKRIMISLYVDDDYFVIDISNKFSGNVDLEKIDDEGYTTKGEGHGYGLSLVKKILSETNTFENERSIKKNVFKQVIKVKIKNT